MTRGGSRRLAVSAAVAAGWVLAGWVLGTGVRRVSVRTRVSDEEAFGSLPGDRVAVEWWTTMIDPDDGEITLPGCLLLRFAPRRTLPVGVLADPAGLAGPARWVGRLTPPTV